MIREILRLDPVITYLSPHGIITDESIRTFSDASFKIGSSQCYGQSGVISGLLLGVNEKSVYHVLYWISTKQKRVSYSSYGAEILACAEADNRGFYLKNAVRTLAKDDDIRHQLCIDSKRIHDTITTLHEGRDCRLRQTVERLRNSFESQELDVLRWIPGVHNIADDLTKRNIKLYIELNNICTTGVLTIDLENGYSLDSKTWR